MNKIGQYVNGNTIVVMYDDGTKERYVRDGEKPVSDFPESVDIKITNRCNIGCAMCAECSTPNGRHANLMGTILESFHPYTELAIGGGNPLEHPGLVSFLKHMKDRKVICNMTVNAQHFLMHTGYLQALVDGKLIYGLGVSVPNEIPNKEVFFNKIKRFPNLVIHTIAGYTPMSTYYELADHHVNILVLGLKEKGLGQNYICDSVGKMAELQHYLKESMTNGQLAYEAIAFDNLAVKQLNVKQWMPKKDFDILYMGDDGDHTMYIDMVKMEYGKSSTHQMHKIPSYDTSVQQMFQNLKTEDDEND